MPMRMNKRRLRNMIDMNDPKVSQIGHPAPPWMVNYADLMTELVCFFVILYALSAALSKGMQDAKEKLDKMMKDQQTQGQVEMKKAGIECPIRRLIKRPLRGAKTLARITRTALRFGRGIDQTDKERYCPRQGDMI